MIFMGCVSLPEGSRGEHYFKNIYLKLPARQPLDIISNRSGGKMTAVFSVGQKTNSHLNYNSLIIDLY